MKQSAVRAARKEQVVTIAPAPSGAGAEILALTEDDFFLLAVRRVVTLPNRVWHATSDAQAADMLMQTPYAVVLIDAALVPNQLEQVITRLKQQLPDLGFVVAGDLEHRVAAQALVDSELVEGFVVKEEAAERLAGVLEAGINRHLELKTEIASKAGSSGGKRGLVVGGVAAVVVAGAVGGWLFLSQEKPAVDPAADVVPVSRPVDASLSVVDAELQKARDAFDAGNYTDPKGRSALDHYRAALVADKSNAEATDGIHRIAEVMLARAEAAMLESKPREAQAAVKVAKSIQPAHPRIGFLEQQISRELERTAAAQQEAARLDAQSQKLSNYMRLANERLSQDRLLDPANDNARHYLMLARDVDSGSVLVTQGLRTLANKLVQKSTQSASRGDMESADQWLTQAKQLGVSGIDFARVERDNRGAQRAKSTDGERLLGLARERLAQGQLIEPENDSARHYVSQLRRQHADTAGLGPVVDSLRDQLLQRATQAAEQSDAKTAQNYLDEAKSIGASGPAFDAAATLVASARVKADALSTVKPVRDNMVVKSFTPEYPLKAQRRKAEGFVDLHFTATVTGDVKDVVVAKAEPAELFDDAAIKAIKRWKFKPAEVNGVPVEQRLSMRIRFELTD